jgi:uncharacterized membrane protein
MLSRLAIALAAANSCRRIMKPPASRPLPIATVVAGTTYFAPADAARAMTFLAGLAVRIAFDADLLALLFDIAFSPVPRLAGRVALQERDHRG